MLVFSGGSRPRPIYSNTRIHRIHDLKYGLWSWYERQRHHRQMWKRWVLLYVDYRMTLQFFQDECGRYHCILAYKFVLYFTYSYLLQYDCNFLKFCCLKMKH